MNKVIEAVYDHGVFRPKDRVRLKDGQTVRVVLPEKRSVRGRQRDQRLRRCFGTWRSGDPHSADNDRIDADLAREYAKNHRREA